MVRFLFRSRSRPRSIRVIEFRATGYYRDSAPRAYNIAQFTYILTTPSLDGIRPNRARVDRPGCVYGGSRAFSRRNSRRG